MKHKGIIRICLNLRVVLMKILLIQLVININSIKYNKCNIVNILLRNAIRSVASLCF